MRLLWLPGVLRAAGLTVQEVPGWNTRGADTYGPVRGITCHHTAGSRTSTVAGEIGTLLHGSSSAPAPIAQLFLARSGEWHVVASGLCHHNLVGWAGPNAGYGNDSLLGIEAQHSGGTEPWTPVQYESYLRGVAALVRHKAPGWDVTAARVAGHKEHQPGAKSDPTFDMTRFRTQVSALVTGPQEDDVTPEDIKKIAAEVWRHDGIPSPWDTAATNPYVVAAGALGDVLRIALDTKALLTAVAARVDVDPAEVQRIAAAVQTAIASSLAALPGAIAAELRADGGLDSAVVTAAVERAMGRLRLTVDPGTGTTGPA